MTPLTYPTSTKIRLQKPWTTMCGKGPLRRTNITTIGVPFTENGAFHAIAMACNSGLIDCNTPDMTKHPKTFHSATSLRSMLARYINEHNFTEYIDWILADISQDNDPVRDVYASITTVDELRAVILDPKLDPKHDVSNIDLTWISNYLGVNIYIIIYDPPKIWLTVVLVSGGSADWWDARPSIILVYHNDQYALAVHPRYQSVYQAMFWPDDIPGKPKREDLFDTDESNVLAATGSTIFHDHHPHWKN